MIGAIVGFYNLLLCLRRWATATDYNVEIERLLLTMCSFLLVDFSHRYYPSLNDTICLGLL